MGDDRPVRYRRAGRGCQGQELAQVFLEGVGVQDLDAEVALVDQPVPHPRERVGGESFAAGEQPPPRRPFGVLLPPSAPTVLAGDPLPQFGEHVIRELDQVEPVGHHDRVGQRGGDRAQGGRGQVEPHVGDPSAPLLGLLDEPISDRGGGPTIDMREQAAGAGGVDDPGVPPVLDDPPPAGLGVLGPHRLAAAGRPRKREVPPVDPEHLDRRQRLGSRGATWATNAACATGQDTPYRRAPDRTHRECSATCSPHSARSRVVSLDRAGTADSDSVNVARGHSGSRQRHRVLCHRSRTGAGP